MAVLSTLGTFSEIEAEGPMCIGLVLLLPAETDNGRDVDWKEERAGLGDAVTSCPTLGGAGEPDARALFGDVLVAGPRGLGASAELTEKVLPPSIKSAAMVEAGLPPILTLGGLDETVVVLGLGCTYVSTCRGVDGAGECIDKGLLFKIPSGAELSAPEEGAEVIVVAGGSDGRVAS